MNRNLIIAGIVGLAVGMLVGGLIGHFATPTSSDDDSGTTTTPLPPITPEQQEIIDKYTFLTTDQWEEGISAGHIDWIIQEIKTENLEDNLRYLSERPHVAGTARDDELATHIKDTFLANGFDWAEMMPYNLYLSRPDDTNPNKIEIKNSADNMSVNFTSSNREQFPDTQEYTDEMIDAFNAFTPAGEFESEPGEGVVYVNYGRVEDFDLLVNEMNISVENRIVMMRYGKIYRGNKIDNAYKYNASAAILYSDPADIAVDGILEENVYPNTWWLPGSGIQRGSAFLGDGDPLTPGWPSTEFAHRIAHEDVDFLKIPAQPIGYDDAEKILEKLGGAAAPDNGWVGGLDLPYNVGPEFLDDFKDFVISIETHNIMETKRSYNVFGTIIGSVEPDRYVLFGNHRDAWGYGASDPSSGTAQLLENARVLGKLKSEQNWRPRRTLVFCSWGAEEYGIIGSTEWVEEHVDKLQGRAVAYVNADTCSSGSVLEMPASPLLWDMSLDIIQMVPGVSNPDKTVYQELVEFQMNHPSYENEEIPVMETLGSGSDFAHFIVYAGIPSMDVWFRRNLSEYDITTYPSYHTGFETFDMVANHTDVGFKYTQGCGRVSALTIKHLADALVLPFNITKFPLSMDKSLDVFVENGIKDKIMDFYDKYEYLEDAVQNLTTVSIEFHNSIANKEFDPVELRKVNDQLMKFEQTFLIPQGLPGREVTRHAIFAPSQFDNYATAGFPGILDLMYDYADLSDEELPARQEEIRIHVSLLTIMTNRAAGILSDVTKFE